MKASEAKELTRKNNVDLQSKFYREVMTLIEKAIKEGKYSVYMTKVINGDLQEQLVEDGYKVNTFSDQRDGDSTTISWG